MTDTLDRLKQEEAKAQATLKKQQQIARQRREARKREEARVTALRQQQLGQAIEAGLPDHLTFEQILELWRVIQDFADNPARDIAPRLRAILAASQETEDAS